MKIKYQQGGVFNLPYIAHQTFLVPEEETTTTSKKSSSSDKGVDMNEIYKLLDDLKDVLPGDLAAVQSRLASLFNNIELKLNHSSVNFDLGGTSSIAYEYLQALSLVNKLKFAHADYETAQTQAIESGSIGEYAINSRGQVIVATEGGFDWKTPEEIFASDGAYVPITNQELLDYRAQGVGGLAFNSASIKTVANGISMNGVTKMIQEVIDKLGTSENSREGYLAIQNKQILNGINIIKEAITKGAFTGDELSIDGLYKNEIITKTQAEQAKMAINYIKRQLPQNAISLLKMKSNGTDEGVDILLTMLTSSRLNYTTNFKTEFQENLNTDGTKKEDSLDKSKINPAIAFQLDMGVETVLPLVAGSSDALFLQAYRMPVTTKEGNPLGITTLDKVSDTSALGGLFDFSHVTMGDQVLDMASSQNVVVDGSSIYKVYLPYDQTKAARGIITPNLNYIMLLEKVRKEVKDSGAKTPEEINAVYEKNNLPPFVDMNGKVNEQFYKPFGVMNATALSDAFPTSVDLNDNINFEEVDDDNEINNYWSIIKGNNTKESFDKKSWYNGIFGDYQQMWKGLIYLPLNSTDPTLGAYSSGDNPSVTTLQDYRARWQQEQRLSTFNPQGQLQI